MLEELNDQLNLNWWLIFFFWIHNSIPGHLLLITPLEILWEVHSLFYLSHLHIHLEKEGNSLYPRKVRSHTLCICI